MGEEASVGTTTSNGLAKSGDLMGPKQQLQLTITRVENGYTINPPYYGGEQKVALTLNSMLDIVQGYFEDKSPKNQ